MSKGLNLGLDLKGGMHLVLEVDLKQAVNNALGRTAQDLSEAAEKRGMALKVGEPAKEALTVTLLNKDEQAAFQKLLKEEVAQVQADMPSRQDGALIFTLRRMPSEIAQLTERTLAQSLEVMRNRM